MSYDQLPHHRLDAYHRAQELVVGVVHLTDQFPVGYSDLRDQLRRSAMATVRGIAEGAGRVTAADKRNRFVIARGEVCECEAGLDTVTRLELVPSHSTQDLRLLAVRVVAMLTGLIKRLDATSSQA